MHQGPTSGAARAACLGTAVDTCPKRVPPRVRIGRKFLSRGGGALDAPRTSRCHFIGHRRLHDRQEEFAPGLSPARPLGMRGQGKGHAPRDRRRSE
eukprot:2295082-Pyramimonas_sp.AAC.1